MATCPLDSYGLAHGQEPISLKTLDGFSPFEFLWDCLDLYLCSIMVICPFNPYGLAHGYLFNQYVIFHWLKCIFLKLQCSTKSPSTCPGWVKLSFWSVKIFILILKLYVLLIWIFDWTGAMKSLGRTLNCWMDFLCSKVLWNCRDLQLCSILRICPCDPYGLTSGPKCLSLKPRDGFSWFKVLWNCLDV